MTSPRRLAVVLAASACVLGAVTWVVLASDTGATRSSTDSSAERSSQPGPAAMPTSPPTAGEAATTSGVYGVPTTGAIPTSIPTDVAVDGTADPDQGPGVFVTFASWSDADGGIDVSAYISGIVETGGTCTATATSAATTSSASSTGQADATTTACAALVVPWSHNDGAATVAVTYTSSTTSASSESQTVEIDR